MHAVPGNQSKLRERTARLLVLASVPATLAVMGAVFWQQDLQYALPTPRPANLRQTPRGSVQVLPTPLLAQAEAHADRPLLLHFYNPDCPCSRFNRDHVHALFTAFGDRVQFVEIVETDAADGAGSGLPIARVVDADGSIARACGIYSTPQALLLDSKRLVVFRGNFNVNRYCSETDTQFVRNAIADLLAGRARPVDPRAEHAYGCALPAEEPDARTR